MRPAAAMAKMRVLGDLSQSDVKGDPPPGLDDVALEGILLGARGWECVEQQAVRSGLRAWRPPSSQERAVERAARAAWRQRR